MRLRFAMLCAALSICAVLVAPGLAGAAPRHDHGLTIAVSPNPIQAGEGVLIHGQLKGTDVIGKTIVLYHHINGSGRGFTEISRAATGPNGFYEFTRAVGIVETNRQWFVRLAGTLAVHSRTVRERVEALVSITPSATTGDTRHAVMFTGHVSPNHFGNRIRLQEEVAGDDWRTIGSGFIGPDSNYTVAHAWRAPGGHTVRAVLLPDRRNIRSDSDSVEVTIEQTENPSFTITTTTPVIAYGDSATITGTLFTKGSAAAPVPNTAIVLCHRNLFGGPAICDQAGITGSDGGYSFTVRPPANAWYYARTVLRPHTRTANLFVGVHDAITLSAPSSGTVGQPAAFTGTVTPDKAGAIVQLQRQGADGDFHTIQESRVHDDGSYAISRVFGTAGTKVFRTRVLSDGANLGAASAPITVVVSLPPVASLPAAS